jgi:hypothetical protein
MGDNYKRIKIDRKLIIFAAYLQLSKPLSHEQYEMYNYTRIDIIELENRILNNIDCIEHPDKLITVERDSLGHILTAHFEDVVEEFDEPISDGYLSENSYDEYNEEESIIIIDDRPPNNNSNEKKLITSSQPCPKLQSEENVSSNSMAKKSISPSILETNPTVSPKKNRDFRESKQDNTTLKQVGKADIEPNYGPKHGYSTSLVELKTKKVELDTFASSIKKQVRAILMYFLTTNESSHLDFVCILSHIAPHFQR